MATTARTPPIGRLAGRPSAPQLTTARPVRTINPPTRPETPSFLDPNVSGVFSTLMHHPTPTGNGLGRPLPRASTNINLAHQVEPIKLQKRQIEVVDLTKTDDQTSSVPAKRLKVEPLVMDRVDPLGPPRRKPTQAIPTGADKRDRQDHHDKMAEESAQWRAKYKKAFPSFVFYFDQLDPTTETYLIKQVRSLGAKTPGFFSKDITHVVTSRNVPLVSIPAANKENGAAGSPPLTNRFPTSSAPTRLGYPAGFTASKRPTGPIQHDPNPFVDSQDILQKASEFGLKIWRTEKIQRVLARINTHSPTKHEPTLARNLSLPSLLRDEQVFGTRERDPFVPRADTYYFPSKSCYFMVTDSTDEHRPICIKEYERPRRGEDPSWPVLWGGIEGRGGFYHYEGPPITYERKRPPPPGNKLVEGAQPSFGMAAARAVDRTGGSLRRTVSLGAKRNSSVANLAGGEYLAASGNSQAITSNIASATSTRSGALARPQGHGLLDKRVQMMSRSVVSMGTSGLGRSSRDEGHGNLKRSVSIDTGLSARVAPPRDEPKKPGYCENCRLKYDDFKDHVVSKKHRKFAKNPANWAELDKLLDSIERPVLEVESLPPSSQESSATGGSYAERSGDEAAGDDSGYFEQMAEDDCYEGEYVHEEQEGGQWDTGLGY